MASGAAEPSAYSGLVRQQWRSSCGAAALATLINITQFRGLEERDVLDWLVASGAPLTDAQDGSGYTLSELVAAAAASGIHSVALSLDEPALDQLVVPALVFLQRPRPHFTVLLPGRGAQGGRRLLDPSLGRVDLPPELFRRWWQGASQRGTLLLLALP